VRSSIPRPAYPPAQLTDPATPNEADACHLICRIRALSVGQHTNDRELSHYARTRSGFEWEVGWNPITVDENTWEPTTHKGIGTCGHTPVGNTIITKLAQFKHAARSLTEREPVVTALSTPAIPDD
jgi:hypothetical protein